jgi:hypothetical protein
VVNLRFLDKAMPLPDSGESVGALFPPSGPLCQASPGASLSHVEAIAGAWGKPSPIQNNSGLSQGPAGQAVVG